MLSPFRPDSVAAAQRRAVSMKTRENKMRLKLVLALSLILPMGAFADDHLPSSTVAAVWECTLNDGATAADVASWGASDFKDWANEQQLNVGSYLWEAVAVNQPFDEADVRWVDYYPSWDDYYAMRSAWLEAGALAEKYDSMVTCSKARFAVTNRTGGVIPEAKEKPLVANDCQLNEGKTMQDVMAFLPKATDLINESAGASITSFLWTNFIGVSGLDYVSFFTGETREMTKVMDGVKNGTFTSAFAEAGLMPPATCESDLHQSHEMVRAAG